MDVNCCQPALIEAGCLRRRLVHRVGVVLGLHPLPSLLLLPLRCVLLLLRCLLEELRALLCRLLVPEGMLGVQEVQVVLPIAVGLQAVVLELVGMHPMLLLLLLPIRLITMADDAVGIPPILRVG